MEYIFNYLPSCQMASQVVSAALLIAWADLEYCKMQLQYSLLLLISWLAYISHGQTNPSNLHITSAQVPATSTEFHVAQPGFAAFACEEVSFVRYANSFSNNLIKQVAQRTGVRAVLRVGGTSLDQSTYNRSQSQPVIIPAGTECLNVRDGITIGPSYFNYFKKLEVAYILDIPLAQNNLDNSVQFATDGYKTIGAANINQLEVGNEPDGYGINETTYTQRWHNFTSSISSALGLSLKRPTYMVPSLASGATWTISDVLIDGGLQDYLGRVRSLSTHYYQTSSSPDSNLQRDLMNHTAITSMLDTKMSGLNYSRAHNLPYILGEVGSALNPSSTNQTFNNYDLEGVFGSALWGLDFMLYAISLGVSRVNYQLGFDFGYALWRPEYSTCAGLPAEVAPPYYAHIVTAEIIGKNGRVRLGNVDFGSPLLSGYKIYDDTTRKLSKIALVNLKYWSSSSNSSRPTTNIKIDVPESTTSVAVHYLSSPKGATASDPSDVTWNGFSWTKASNGIAAPNRGITNDTTVKRPYAGSVYIPLSASSAAVLSIQY